MELTQPALDRLRAAVLEVVSHGDGADAEGLRAVLAGDPLEALIRRLDGQIAAAGYWEAAPAAADRDAEEGWLQALTLQRRERTLHRELRDAEAALAKDPSDANHARLVDIKNQLVNSEGTEALIEGFGTSSGRQARVF